MAGALCASSVLLRAPINGTNHPFSVPCMLTFHAAGVRQQPPLKELHDGWCPVRANLGGLGGGALLQRPGPGRSGGGKSQHRKAGVRLDDLGAVGNPAADDLPEYETTVVHMQCMTQMRWASAGCERTSARDLVLLAIQPHWTCQAQTRVKEQEKKIMAN